MAERRKVLLVDLPTFPKGVLSLSLPAVAAGLRPDCDVRIADLNFTLPSDYRKILESSRELALCGLKVSAQNLMFAERFTALAREVHPEAKIVWGGELPTHMPEECLKSADSVVLGRFEPHARALLRDLEKGALARRYGGGPQAALNGAPPPALDLVENPEAYLRFMGSPLESSTGCSENCTFCMVHTMQGRKDFRAPASLERDLRENPRPFINVVDYNIGTRREHLVELAGVLGRSRASGWMGEACLKTLDDNDLLETLRSSRCRIIYCGLESLSRDSLKTINKIQNDAASYRRVIRKAQAHGIEIASGFILGLAGTTAESYSEFADFCDDVGILYLKLTHLTFNPGTKVQRSMASKGRYLSERSSDFDGNRLTFLPEGVEAETVLKGARSLIERFYSLGSLWRRSRHLASRPRRRAEFMLFSHCFGRAYRQWIEYGLLNLSGGRFEEMLGRPMKKGLWMSLAEKALCGLRGG